jgi:riboflavin kinase / FMN adenylyltransferase
MPASDFIVARTTEEWIKHFPRSTDRAVVTIGNFDGVHLGHQKILQAVRERAESLQQSSNESRFIPAVITFYPHPACILRPEAAPPLLMTLPQRLAAFERAGIRAALVVQFDPNLARLSPEGFARRYLVETMRAEAVLVGENFRFGHKQAGDVNLLRELGRPSGFETEAIAPVVIDGTVVSSTAIRMALREGRVEEARTLLGRPYALAGQIRTGTGLGSKLVVPTLNLATDQELLPKRGVYVTEIALDGVVYRAATNVGVRPTFDGSATTVESHLLNFSETRTSGSMEVRFFQRLRDEMKFAGPEPLREQILRDIELAREYFPVPKN